MKIPKNKWGDLIKRIKFLNNQKFYKNNVWCMAAWDSWAAQGQAGGCHCCSAKHYNGSLENKRRPFRTRWDKKWQCNDITKLCSDCIGRVEEIIEYKFSVR